MSDANGFCHACHQPIEPTLCRACGKMHGGVFCPDHTNSTWWEACCGPKPAEGTDDAALEVGLSESLSDAMAKIAQKDVLLRGVQDSIGKALDRAEAAEERAKRAEGELATVLAERDAAVSMGTQLERERDAARMQARAWKMDFDAELAGSAALRGAYGARPNETFHAFFERVISERDAAESSLAALRERAGKLETSLHNSALMSSAIAGVLMGGDLDAVTLAGAALDSARLVKVDDLGNGDMRLTKTEYTLGAEIRLLASPSRDAEPEVKP